MLYLTREDSLELLPLSARSSNCLRRAGIHTVGQLLDYPADKWLDIRNMGTKSVDEVLDLAARIRAGDGFQMVASKPKPPEPPPPPRLPDIPVPELGLSVRANNCLENMGVRTAADLSDATLESLLAVKNMGRKTAEQIMEKLEELRKQFSFSNAGGSALPEEPGGALCAMVKDLSVFTKLPQGDLLRYLAPCWEASPNAEEAELLDLAFQQGPIRREARRAILRLLEPYEEAVSPEELLKFLPAGTSIQTLKLLLGDLLRREQITIRNNRVLRRWPTALEFAERLPDQRQRELLLARLGGATLEEAGQCSGITRERVRQLVQKALAGRPRLYEDQYQYLFNHYDVSLEEFQLAFDEPEETYHYLEMVRPKGERKPIRELMEDESVPVPLRRKVERAVYRQYVTIDGIRVLKGRQEMVRYAVRTFCRDTTAIDEFFPQYQQLLESLGLERDGSLAIDSPAYIENRLQICNYALWSQWRRFRYYPIAELDFSPLLEALELERYEDMEITSLKLFRDYPELMREYDIRDEYELHNLLKKIWPQDDERVRFKKMPTIEIGTPDRDRQVLDLLRRYSPIANTDLAQRYEEAYGVKSATALGSYFAYINPYFHNGVYRLDQPPLPEEQQRRMKALLTEDFYRTAEIRRIYRREFPGNDAGNLNPFVLKSLGFRPYEDYVVSTRYSSAADYFRRLLTDRDVVDMTRENRRYAGISAYSSELDDLKSRREIVEFLPLQYISLRRLRSAGVNSGDLADYCAAAHAFTRPGEYFTVASLRRAGFAHPLDDLGFDEWFYGSLLAEDPERFTYRRMGGNRLFCRTGEIIQLADFLRWLVEAEPSGRIDIYELLETLEQQYGISLPLHKLTSVIQNSELYYDSIMKAVYIDYDTYLEEI
ncbi:DNA-directed RNA polymerase subunit alpha C-terminal domain-containing protein [uncultured Oscillibacter sp.]|uniref:DNA-directed RNA polymerase subunit alpha C-terminal domain-containing protein n=1 Tax=uncultured Oscillibacter sp. TaxID=876091 RepID=UPI00260E1EF5|nr:DNA-directed RNA polymerase subunit alpha C-terminal domain-containing protein [uncultured Oscillibacter sp.]